MKIKKHSHPTIAEPSKNDGFGDHVDGDDFRRLGIRAHEWRPSVIRRAASRTAKGLARRLLRHQSSKVTHQLTEVSLTTYRLLDPRRRDDAHARAHIGRILPQTLSSSEIVFQTSADSDLHLLQGDQPPAISQNEAETIVMSLPPAVASSHWTDSLSQDDILSDRFRQRRNARLLHQSIVIGILLAAALVGIILGLRSLEKRAVERNDRETLDRLDHDRTNASLSAPPMIANTNEASLSSLDRDERFGPPKMALPHPTALDSAQSHFYECYVDPKTLRTAGDVRDALKIADEASGNHDHDIRYVAALHSLRWSWAVEERSMTAVRVKQFSRTFDVPPSQVLTQSYVSALASIGSMELTSHALESLPTVVGYLERNGAHGETLTILDQVSLLPDSERQSVQVVTAVGETTSVDAAVTQWRDESQSHARIASLIRDHRQTNGQLPANIDFAPASDVGEYLAFVQEQWTEALTWFSQGENQVFASAASNEEQFLRSLEPGAEIGNIADVIDGWQTAADAVDSSLHRAAILRHIDELIEWSKRHVGPTGLPPEIDARQEKIHSEISVTSRKSFFGRL